MRARWLNDVHCRTAQVSAEQRLDGKHSTSAQQVDEDGNSVRAHAAAQEMCVAYWALLWLAWAAGTCDVHRNVHYRNIDLLVLGPTRLTWALPHPQVPP